MKNCTEYLRSRKIKVGDLFIGGGAPVVLQTMTNTKTSDFIATSGQVQELSDNGCSFIRLAIDKKSDLVTFKKLRKKFSKLIFSADLQHNISIIKELTESGIDCIRINPGYFTKGDIQLYQIFEQFKKCECTLRIGFNTGSFEAAVPDPAIKIFSKLEFFLGIAREVGFEKIKVSLKSSDMNVFLYLNREYARKYDFPLHIGITEAGSGVEGTVKATLAAGILLEEGIGDTVRLSISGHPLQEIKAGNALLDSLKLKKGGIKFISCPTCSRANYDVERISESLKKELKNYTGSKKIGIMGCVINGPGEAKDCDLCLVGGKKELYLYERESVIAKCKIDSLDKMLSVIKEHLGE